MAGGMSSIKHLVVVMMENRSFDNFLGWLYGPGDSPSQLIGGNPGDPPFLGLVPDSFWNPANASFFQGDPPRKVFATKGTTGPSPYTVPDPNPLEGFNDMTFQIFGTTNPAPDQHATMLGFLVDYQKRGSTNPASIMETYSPGELPVLSGLARNYAVSDAWFASAPCETWPNRSFVHTGTSNGQVNNSVYDPFDYDIPTIFNVLEAAGHTWAVYNPGPFISLTRLQFPQLYDLKLESHFRSITDFVEQAKAGTLPAYSFVEPAFVGIPQGADDQHPPHDVCLGEQFLLEIYRALAGGKNWEETLLVITYDEHGGCPDHVPPPWGAATPDKASDPGQEGFRFNRFSVRVPLVLVSPWIQAGTVFRSTTGVPLDHTSILATLRDWLAIPNSLMLGSLRVAAAPTLDGVLNLTTVRQDKPAISSTCSPSVTRHFALEPPNPLQLGMAAAMVCKRAGQTVAEPVVQQVLSTLRSREDVARFLVKSAHSNDSKKDSHTG
ncbi:MAG: alkaline phosphatase family protein [Isosphaeraceae bacterium]